MKVFLLMLFLMLTYAKVYACLGGEVRSCESVLAPSADKCRNRYEILYDMHFNSPHGAPKASRGMQCGYSGFRCVRMGSLCTKNSF